MESRKNWHHTELNIEAALNYLDIYSSATECLFKTQ